MTSHNQKMALEALQEIIDSMKETGLELYQEYAPLLLEAGLDKVDLAMLKKDIETFVLAMKSAEIINKKLRTSAVTITKMEVLEILYKEEQLPTARLIEQQLKEQGYDSFPSVNDKEPIQRDIFKARLRKIVGSDVA